MAPRRVSVAPVTSTAEAAMVITQLPSATILVAVPVGIQLLTVAVNLLLPAQAAA
jgi:hypothetical protein